MPLKVWISQKRISTAPSSGRRDDSVRLPYEEIIAQG
jgi:hypothetical protein